jgi:cytochrome d ubiquinol oxidase subunit I
MNDLTAARAQMGTSLAFHIVFAAVGIGLPLMLVVAEGMYLRTKDKTYLALAKKWAKATAILFAVGAVSGTVLSFELGLLWPGFMQYAGSIVGMPFSLEGYAFFIEAIFLGLYLYGRSRLTPFVHWLTTIPIAISGAISGVFIVSVNGWMNAPSGFDVINGKVTNIDPIKALFNPAWGVESLHSTLSSYISVGFAAAAIYAVAMLRGKRDSYHRKALTITLLIACITLPLQFVSGDLSAKWVAQNQPTKLAAMEGHFVTQTCAPLNIGGIPNTKTGETDFAIQIPCGLSFLATYDPNAKVVGLNDIPPELRPNTVVVHIAFQLMVGAGVAMLLVAMWVGIAWWRNKRRLPDGKWLLRAIALCGPLGFLALEAGWTVTEVGRQPWVVYGFLMTKDSATSAPGILPIFILFSVIYVTLAVIVVWLLRRLAKTMPEVEQAHQEQILEEEEKDYANI